MTAPEIFAQRYLAEVALLGLCDRLGRLHTNLAAEEANVHRFIQKCGR